MRGSYRRTAREFFGVFSAAFSPSNDFVPPSSSEPFQYTPLASPTNFRILHLRNPAPGSWSEDSSSGTPLFGSLIEASIDAPPEYYALSYTWGDPAPCETIVVDGRRLGITSNCAAALRRMLRGKGQRHIWVDSICINQADTPEALRERGGQVAMMDEIYRKAIQVNVHLGPGDRDSDVACSALKKLAVCYLGASVPGPQQALFRRKYESLADDVLAITPEYPYGKLYGVFRRPWFARSWVVQEVVFGRDVIVYCGKHLVRFKLMVMAADFTRLPYSKAGADPAARHWRSYLEYHDAMNEYVRRRDEGEPLSNFDLTLCAVLMTPAIMLEATRPEDKVHALYGVCKRLGFELPAPDYSKPLAVVYTETARAILRYDSSLEMLTCVCESSGWEKGLPSWVPNFSGSSRSWSPSNPPHLAVFGKGSPAVSCHTQSQFELMLDGQALRVRGRRLDALCAAGMPWMVDATENVLGGSGRATEQVLSSFIDCISTWFDVVQAQPNRLVDSSVVMQQLAGLLTYDAAQSGQLSPGRLESFSRCLSVLISEAKSNQGAWQQAGPTNSESYRGPQDDLRLAHFLRSPEMQSFIGIMAPHHWKTVFRTLGGYLGVGTHTAQEGDIVVVLYGSTLASILRPWGDWFRYVGPAYVHGISNGEFWDSKSAADDEWFVLI